MYAHLCLLRRGGGAGGIRGGAGGEIAGLALLRCRGWNKLLSALSPLPDHGFAGVVQHGGALEIGAVLTPQFLDFALTTGEASKRTKMAGSLWHRAHIGTSASVWCRPSRCWTRRPGRCAHRRQRVGGRSCCTSPSMMWRDRSMCGMWCTGTGWRSA